MKKFFDFEVGDVWLPSSKEEKENIVEINGTEYKKISYKEVRVGDFILTKEKTLEKILDLLPFGGYTDYYFLTSKIGDSESEIRRYRMPSEVESYLRI
ncbi:MAG: hypothetical protein KatS3mg001_574 [Candidatus Pacearchaeota archaeon]|nr:MAG: hypothetical protein KatS3mg001_574 [Candidatus Pacearchaeota archaeon]